MHYIDGRGIKSELRIYLTNHLKFKSCHLLFMTSGVDTNKRTHAYPHESDFKKPDVCLLQASVRMVYK